MKYKINPRLPELLGQHMHTLSSFCRQYDVPQGTLRAALNPEAYPDRAGGVQPKTAWRLARAWAALTGTDEQAAFAEIIVIGEAQDERP
jgi:hypothetical protein